MVLVKLPQKQRREGSFSLARADGGVKTEAREGLTQILNEGFRIINVGIDSGATSWSDGFDFVKLEFARDLFDDLGLNRALLFDKPIYESVLTK